MLGNECRELFRIPGGIGQDDMELNTGDERGEGLGEGVQESDGGLLGMAFPGRTGELALGPGQAVDQGPVGIQDPLGGTGGAGGVEDVGEVGGRGEGLEVGVGEVDPVLGIAVEAEDGGGSFRQGG